MHPGNAFFQIRHGCGDMGAPKWACHVNSLFDTSHRFDSAVPTVHCGLTAINKLQKKKHIKHYFLCSLAQESNLATFPLYVVDDNKHRAGPRMTRGNILSHRILFLFLLLTKQYT